MGSDEVDSPAGDDLPAPLFASSPPRPPSAATVGTWPSSILLDIFLYAASPSPSDSPEFAEQCAEDVCGGSLARWRLTVCLRPLALVCRGWRDAATTALYRSVAINTSHAASRFLDTLSANPSLRPKVKRLCVGYNNTHPHSDSLETSRTMIHILELCHNLAALQLRLLHKDLDDQLLSALDGVSSTLEAFVAGPQHYQQEEGVDLRPLPCSAVQLVVRRMKALRSLELNVWTEKGGHGTRWRQAEDGKQSGPLPIEQLGVYSELDDEVLEGLLGACTRLAVLDIYVEKDVRTLQFKKALHNSTATMKSLRIVINTTSLRDGTLSPIPGGRRDPVAVLFDKTLLPTYLVIERLHLCHNVTSPAIFTFLPISSTLKHLSLHSLAPAASDSDHFRYTPQLLADLLDPSRTPHVDVLEMVRIRDVRVEWGDEELKKVQEAFEARGVAFRWDEDYESTGGGTGSGSATGSTSNLGGPPASDPASVLIANEARLVDGTNSNSANTSPASADSLPLGSSSSVRSSISS